MGERLSTSAIAGAALSPVHCAFGPKAVRVEMNDHIFRPAIVGATPDRIATLKVPPGFTETVIATGLTEPRVLAVAPNGDLYVSRRVPLSGVLLLRAKDHGPRDQGINDMSRMVRDTARSSRARWWSW